MPSTPRRRHVLAALTLLALAGCGTTVPQSSISAADGGSGTLGGGTATGGATTGGATGTTTGGATTGASLSAGGTTGTVTSGSTGTAPGTSGTGGATGGPGITPVAPGAGQVTGRGFTAGTVKLGVATADDYNAFVGSVGLKGLDVGDIKGQMDAVVADINKRGGLGGRKVVLVPHDYNTGETVSDPARAHQAACATWTQDNKVLAVLMPPLPTANLYECLQKAKTPIVTSGIEFPRVYQATYDKYPDLFHVSTMVGELYDELAVSRLVKRGYFTPWDVVAGKPGGTAPVKVGVIVRNDNEGPAQEKSIRRALAKHGITPASVDHCTSTINASSCMQSVELRYQTNGITHVFGNSDLIFMNTANSQNYHPRYFMPGSLDGFAQNAPRAQLRGAMAESFTPSADVVASKDPGPPTPATGRCLSIMRKSGQDTSSRAAVAQMLATCDAFHAVVAAVTKRGGTLYDRVVQDGLGSLGVFESAETWATRLDARHRAAVYGLRDLAFDEQAGSFTYTSRTTYTS